MQEVFCSLTPVNFCLHSILHLKTKHDEWKSIFGENTDKITLGYMPQKMKRNITLMLDNT